ncbi:unnamed protein product [Closterium sp. NIES-54]
MYALTVSAEGDCYLCVPPNPDREAAALGVSEYALPGTAPAEALHTFTLDSGASRCFFRDSTTLTPLPPPVPLRLADPSGGPVLARSPTVLLCPVVPSGSLSGLHLRSFSTNLVSTAALQDAMVTTTTPGGQRVSICTCTWTGRHVATFTHRPGSSLYTLTTEPRQVAASGQVSASGLVAAPCLCRLLLHQTLLWYQRLGHPSLPRLGGMHSRLLVSGLPRSLPPLPPSPAPPCLPYVKGQQHAAPHSSPFPLKTHPLLTLHMDVHGGRHTSMIHAAAPHFLWPFAVRYAAHHLNLWPRVSLPETSPIPRWTGEVGDAACFESEGAELGGAEPEGAEPGGTESRGADPGSPVSAGGPTGASSRREPLCPPQLREWFARCTRLWSGTARAGGPTGGGTGAEGTGAAGSGGTRNGGTGGTGAAGAGGTAGTGARDPGAGGARAGGTGGAGPGGAGSRGTGAAGAGGDAGTRGAGGAGAAGPGGAAGAGGRDLVAGGAGAGGTGGAGAAGPGGARTGGTRAAGAGGAAGAGAGDPRGGGARAGDPGAADAGAGDPGVGGTGPGGARALGTGARGTVRPRPFFVPLLRHVLSLPSSTGLNPPLLCPPPDQSQPQLQFDSPLPAPSPNTEQADSLSEHPARESHPTLPVCTACTGHRAPCPRPPPIPGTHVMALRPSSVPLRVPLPSPLVSSLPNVSDPESDLVRAACPTFTRLLANVVTDPSFEYTVASALVTELVDFAAVYRLDYAASLVAESEPDCPPFDGGEYALGTDVLEDKQEDFECLAAAVPHLVSMLLAPEGDPDAPDIRIPCSYAEAIMGPYSSQWQTAMDAKDGILEVHTHLRRRGSPTWGKHSRWHVDFQGEAAAGFSACLQGTLRCTRL